MIWEGESSKKQARNWLQGWSVVHTGKLEIKPPLTLQPPTLNLWCWGPNPELHTHQAGALQLSLSYLSLAKVESVNMPGPVILKGRSLAECVWLSKLMTESGGQTQSYPIIIYPQPHQLIQKVSKQVTPGQITSLGSLQVFSPLSFVRPHCSLPLGMQSNCNA